MIGNSYFVVEHSYRHRPKETKDMAPHKEATRQEWLNARYEQVGVPA